MFQGKSSLVVTELISRRNHAGESIPAALPQISIFLLKPWVKFCALSHIISGSHTQWTLTEAKLELHKYVQDFRTSIIFSCLQLDCLHFSYCPSCCYICTSCHIPTTIFTLALCFHGGSQTGWHRTIVKFWLKKQWKEQGRILHAPDNYFRQMLTTQAGIFLLFLTL